MRWEGLDYYVYNRLHVVAYLSFACVVFNEQKAKKTLDEYLSRVKETATNLDTIDKSDLAELK